MKKNLLFIATAFTMLALLFNSCDQVSTSSKVTLKNEVDTLSYSFGASVGESFMRGTLQQLGIVTDTTAIYASYTSQLKAEQDPAKKIDLGKEMRHKIDSTYKASQYAINEFIKGVKDGMNSRTSEKSYNVGLFFGTQIKEQDMVQINKQFFNDEKELNKGMVVAGLASAILQKGSVLPSAPAYMDVKAQEMQKIEAEKRMKEAEKFKEEGEQFLAGNKDKEGVITLESGVQYKILTEGTGAKPTATDRVKCHYHGTLIDGTVFDSSVERGEAITFGVNQVIPGWTEILQLMPVGSKWEVCIPYDKAYGEQGSGDRIPPYSALVFQVEVLSIEK